jgi:hypothetical protein
MGDVGCQAFSWEGLSIFWVESLTVIGTMMATESSQAPCQIENKVDRKNPK